MFFIIASFSPASITLHRAERLFPNRPNPPSSTSLFITCRCVIRSLTSSYTLLLWASNSLQLRRGHHDDTACEHPRRQTAKRFSVIIPDVSTRTFARPFGVAASLQPQSDNRSDEGPWKFKNRKISCHRFDHVGRKCGTVEASVEALIEALRLLSQFSVTQTALNIKACATRYQAGIR